MKRTLAQQRAAGQPKAQQATAPQSTAQQHTDAGVNGVEDSSARGTHGRLRRNLAAAALFSLVLGAGVAGGAGAPPSSAIEPSDAHAASCAADKLYGLVNYLHFASGGFSASRAPAQILEFGLDATGAVATPNPATPVFMADDPLSEQTRTSDALGMGPDCELSFVKNRPGLQEQPHAVDILRVAAIGGDTPRVVQELFPLGAAGIVNVSAGAVAPNGDYYFAYATRVAPGYTPGVTEDALRVVLYRYEHIAGQQHAPGTQPTPRSGAVAFIDVPVPEESFALRSSWSETVQYAHSAQLHGDLAFDAAGNLIYYLASETVGAESDEQLHFMLSSEAFEDLPGRWPAQGELLGAEMPRLRVPASALRANQTPYRYAGVGFDALGRAQVLSVAPDQHTRELRAVLSRIDANSLDPVDNSASVFSLPVPAIPGLEGAAWTMAYPTDLASPVLAGTVAATLTTDALAEEGDTFSLTARDEKGAVLASSEAIPGARTAMILPRISLKGQYTITQEVSDNAEAYRTAWSCSDEDNRVVASGVGTVAAVDVALSQAVSCAMTNSLVTPEAARVSTLLTSAPGSGAAVRVGDTITYSATLQHDGSAPLEVGATLALPQGLRDVRVVSTPPGFTAEVLAGNVALSGAVEAGEAAEVRVSAVVAASPGSVLAARLTPAGEAQSDACDAGACVSHRVVAVDAVTETPAGAAPAGAGASGDGLAASGGDSPNTALLVASGAGILGLVLLLRLRRRGVASRAGEA